MSVVMLCCLLIRALWGDYPQFISSFHHQNHTFLRGRPNFSSHHFLLWVPPPASVTAT